MHCSLAYGRTGLVLDLPDSWDITVLRRKPMPLTVDPGKDVAAALDQPLGCRPLAEEAAGMRTACILICDITRPAPNGRVLRPLIERLLDAGLQPSGITVLVATGLHRPNEDGELVQLLGDPWVREHAKVENHFARRDEDHVLLGTTSQGIAIRLDKRFVDAEVRVVVGLVEPHFMAGWSGGRKLVLPGIAHAQTITAFHSAHMLEHELATAGVLRGNPLHSAQGEAIRMVGSIRAVSLVIDENHDLSSVSYGEVEQSLAAAVAFSEPYVVIPVHRRYPVVLSTAAGFPLDATYYQTVKGICTGASILEPGGDLFIASACSEGLGSADFRQSQQRMVLSGPRQFREEMSARAHADIDEWETLMLARALDAGAVHIFAEGLTPVDRHFTGVIYEKDLEAGLIAAVTRAPGHSLAIIPDGPYIIPRLT